MASGIPVKALVSDQAVKWIGLAAWRSLCLSETPALSALPAPGTLTHTEIVEVEESQPSSGSDFDKAKAIAESLAKQLYTAISERGSFEVVNPSQADVPSLPSDTTRWSTWAWSASRGIGIRFWAKRGGDHDDRLTMVAQVVVRCPTHSSISADQWRHQ